MIVVVSGPGGVGKDTIVSRLLKQTTGLERSRSWTTRTRRSGEGDDAYRFVDRAEFERHTEDGGFLEWVEYLGNLYGTPLPSVNDGDAADLILVIEVEGAAAVLRDVPGARMILVVPPSPEKLAERMRARGDDEAHVAERVARAIEEEEIGRRLAHDVVVNDSLDRALEETAGILRRYRAQRASPAE